MEKKTVNFSMEPATNQLYIFHFNHLGHGGSTIFEKKITNWDRHFLELKPSLWPPDQQANIAVNYPKEMTY